jgi:hypothetical protein
MEHAGTLSHSTDLNFVPIIYISVRVGAFFNSGAASRLNTFPLFVFVGLTNLLKGMK